MLPDRSARTETSGILGTNCTSKCWQASPVTFPSPTIKVLAPSPEPGNEPSVAHEPSVAPLPLPPGPPLELVSPGPCVPPFLAHAAMLSPEKMNASERRTRLRIMGEGYITGDHRRDRP